MTLNEGVFHLCGKVRTRLVKTREVGYMADRFRDLSTSVTKDIEYSQFV